MNESYKNRYKSILLKKINALKTILMRQKNKSYIYVCAKNTQKNVHTFFI